MNLSLDSFAFFGTTSTGEIGSSRSNSSLDTKINLVEEDNQTTMTGQSSFDEASGSKPRQQQLSGKDENRPPVAHRRVRSAGNLYEHNDIMFKGLTEKKSTTTTTTSSSGIPIHRQLSHPDLTARQREMVDKHKGILLVKRQSFSTNENTNVFAEMEAKLLEERRRRRHEVLKNGVTFGTIEIREHPIIMGDNPGGYNGPPLAIDWDHQAVAEMKLDDFEAQRPPRRLASEMNIPSSVREEMLKKSGYSRGQIQVGMKHVTISRNRRKRTLETLQMFPVHNFMERLARGTKNATVGRGRKKKERQYIKDAMNVHKHILDSSVSSSLEGSLHSVASEEFDDQETSPVMMNGRLEGS